MTFTQKEFDDWKTFARRMEREFGEQTYVQPSSACMLVNFSDELCAMIRPLPQEKHFEFDLKLLSCKQCKKKALYLCLPTQLDYQCDDCKGKAKKTKEVALEPTKTA